MAKSSPGQPTDDSKLVDFAEDLGRILGETTRRAETWLSQRQQVTEQLQTIRDTAGRLLDQLGEVTSEAVRRGRPRAEAVASAAVAGYQRGARKGRKLSEETRQKMRDAWARRKAAAAQQASAKSAKRARKY
jgi:hypothetical protein